MKDFSSTSTFSPSHPGSNQYLQDSCSDTETGMCDTDSFGSRLSGNGSGSIAGEFKHIKEEIENDEDYFRLLANQTRTMRHFDGKYDSTFLHETFQTRFALSPCFDHRIPIRVLLHRFPTAAIPTRGLSENIYGFSMAVERKSFSLFLFNRCH